MKPHAPRPVSRKRAFPGSGSLRVLGYLRVSTAEQASNGSGLDAQRAAIEAEAERRGWNVRWIEDAGLSARDLRRAGIQEALRLLHNGEADALVVAKLDRLSRSLLDFAGLMERSRREGWKLVALDLGVDTSTPSGEMMANVLASFAQFERRLIGQRTAEALRAKQAAGVRLGRPSTLPDEVRERIGEARSAGATYAAIADALNRDGIPTAHGAARWRPSTVAWVLRAA
jgi:DNA invertase Pin-like site-specific DNA recombinase